MERAILLADMNSFFASCHQAVQPELQGLEVIVAGDPTKRTGIVLAASYPAKSRGIKTGMPVHEARQLCPDGYFFRPDYQLYIDISSRILGIMRNITDLVEPFSIDEAFADLTGVLHLRGTPRNIASQLKERIKSEVDVLCSIGIGPNKLAAKMAAGVQKPDGLTILESIDDFKKVFWPQPVRELFGIGPRYEKHLRYLNIRTIGDLANFPLPILQQRWGKNGYMLWLCANGIDHSPVVPTSLDASKSIGQQKTLPRDLVGFTNIKVVLLELCELVARRVRQGGYMGRTVVLTLRDTQLRFLSRSLSMNDYTDLPDEIYHIACRILHKHWHETWAVRLVGITLSNLIKRAHFQPDIFGERTRLSKLARACDKIKDRFGERAIIRGVSLKEESISNI
ncbi:DNA polymerase IV [Desulfoscipio gibsoniae]|uniref:DNA polymerase IV n=1 Tax=Desulfoscipio gibsoniae DSM 7213 TaxID=767817 RepID=R4KQ75_9FIRM|nr:DNA polymerase IV [Desulfoscipio gibsoniae]AGL02730.1 nucleotidyltransferase/DNA polymerase involved in DNA repair [Desulfoscipio gibsoniae DSM 7213]